MKSNTDANYLKIDDKNEIISPWKIAINRLKKNKLAMLSIVILLILSFLAIFAPFLTPYERDGIDMSATSQAPSAKHLLGTDGLGRDILTRIIYGGRISLSVGIVAVTIQIIIGTLLGCLAGFYGGKVNTIIMRFTDIIMCFPSFMIALTIVAVVGPSIYNIMLVIGFLGWTGLARMVRGQVLSLKEQEFMLATEALGISDKRKIFRHLFPNIAASIIVFGTLGIAGSILTESALSFLGLGVSPPTPSWGNMLESAKNLSVIKNQLWLWIPPGIAILLTVMSLNILGDGLRNALDPKLKE